MDISDGNPRSNFYVSDSNGQIMQRVTNTGGSSNPWETFFKFNGVRRGDVTNNGAR